jgi:Fic family protein
MDTPQIKITQQDLKLIASIDEFKGRWQALSTLARDDLKALKRVATIESVGSSTRIEGAQLSDREVEQVLTGLRVSRFETRDEQEVAGYAECMELVFDSFDQLEITENHIKQLHQNLLKHSTKDERHRGEYKKLPNHVEAFDSDGKSLGVIFETASPFETPYKMEQLVEWYGRELREEGLHSLLRTGVFIVNFLAIHPFQDGNGRLSRILTTLMLLKSGYSFCPYSSLEKIIEENKEQYYLALRKAQQTIYKDNSTLMAWITFFLESIRKQVGILETKIENQQRMSEIPQLSKQILDLARDHGRVTVRDVHKITNANRNTIKSHIKRLVQKGILDQQGKGKGTWYKPA